MLLDPLCTAREFPDASDFFSKPLEGARAACLPEALMFSVIFNIILIGIVAMVLISVILGPVYIRFFYRTSSRVIVSRVGISELPEAAVHYFDTCTPDLEGEGFSVVGDFILSGSIKGNTVYFRFFANRGSSDSAMCAFIVDITGGKRREVPYVEFCTGYSDGSEIDTNNSKLPGAFKAVPEKRVFQYPAIRDVGRLYRLHVQRVSEFGGSRRKELPAAGHEEAYFRRSFLRDFDRQVEVGYFTYDSFSGDYRPTWRGAYGMVWRSLFANKTAGIKK